MKKASSKKRIDPGSGTEVHQVNKKLQLIEEQLAQMQFTLDEMRSQNQSPQHFAEVTEREHNPFSHYPEPPLFNPQASPFVYQPAPKQSGWIDNFIAMLEDPKIRQLIRSLSKKVEEEKKGSKRN